MVESVLLDSSRAAVAQLLARSAHESAVLAAIPGLYTQRLQQAKEHLLKLPRRYVDILARDPHADDTRADSYEKQSTCHTGRSKLRQNPSAISQNLKEDSS